MTTNNKPKASPSWGDGRGAQIPVPSSILGSIMAGNGDECIAHLINQYVSARYKRSQAPCPPSNKTDSQQQEALALYTALNHIPLKANTKTLSNLFISACPPYYLGRSIRRALHTFQIIPFNNLNNFLHAIVKPDPALTWQAQGYMALTGAQEHTLILCLLNATPDAITTQLSIASPLRGDGRGAASPLRGDGREAASPPARTTVVQSGRLRGNGRGAALCQQIERNNIFDINQFIQQNPDYQLHTDISEWDHDIPQTERCQTITIPRDDAKILAMYDKIKECTDSVCSLLSAVSS